MTRPASPCTAWPMETEQLVIPSGCACQWMQSKLCRMTAIQQEGSAVHAFFPGLWTKGLFFPHCSVPHYRGFGFLFTGGRLPVVLQKHDNAFLAIGSHSSTGANASDGRYLAIKRAGGPSQLHRLDSVH